MSLFAQGTYHRAPDSLFDGDWFYIRCRGNSNDLTRRDHYGHAYCVAEEWNYDSPDTDGSLWGWGCRDAEAHLIRYMNAFARKIQRCWFNREELPMACPCPESP